MFGRRGAGLGDQGVEMEEGDFGLREEGRNGGGVGGRGVELV